MSSERPTFIVVLAALGVVAMVLAGSATIWGGSDTGWAVYMLLGLGSVSSLAVLVTTYRYWSGRERPR